MILRVSEVVSPDADVRVFSQAEPLHDILAAVASSDQSTFPVLDDAGELTGVISLEQLRRVMNEHLPAGLLIAQDLMVSDFPRIAPQTDLAAALRLFSGVQLEQIVVWDDEKHQFVGLLSRTQLTRTYVERMASLDVS